jgi:hypothetical protein
LNADVNALDRDHIVRAAAKSRVTSWVSESRTGLDNLAANATVSQLLYVLGEAFNGLPAGWARDLLKTGKVTISTGQTLDLGSGTWSNTKYVPRNDHNDHAHVSSESSEKIADEPAEPNQKLWGRPTRLFITVAEGSASEKVAPAEVTGVTLPAATSSNVATVFEPV